MKDRQFQNTHYLSFCYNSLITNKIIHGFLFLIEIVSIFLQIIEIYYNDYKSLKSEKIKIFSYISPTIKSIIKLKIIYQFLIYILIILIPTVSSFILNNFNFQKNKFLDVIINLNEILFYRIGVLFIFHYLFILNDIYLIFGIIFSIPYIIILITSFNTHHLFTFFFSFVKYPYDIFTNMIEIYLLIVKIFISIASTSNDENLSKLFFILSIVLLLFLQIYLTYILFYKSYFLMNNVVLNKVRYSILLSNCLIILLILINKKNFDNTYLIICYGNILILSILIIGIFYDPYEFIKFKTDDNEENAINYFFVLDKDKNNNLLLEKKIDEHINKCGRCNLCKKYEEIKDWNKMENIDLYNIIYNNKNYALNLMNKIIKHIRKKGKNSVGNNSYFLINLVYIYYLGIIQKDYCFFLNTELIYQLINSENNQNLDDYQIYIDKIKYTNNFLLISKKILDIIHKIIEENKLEAKYSLIFKFGTLLEKLKIKEIKDRNNSGNNNTTDKNLNCNNILTICSIFYEELYNESISNSRIYIRDSQNLLDDLINNNYKNNKLITLEIDSHNFQVKIIRAGGYLNLYENNSLFDLFPEIFKSKQISLMKKILINSNSDYDNDNTNKNNNNNKNSTKNEIQNMNFNFIIEIKEENEIYYQLLKLKLNLLILKTISTIIYLNGIYKIDKDIIITEKKKKMEFLFHLGNKEHKNIITDKNKDNKIQIRQKNGVKYLINKKLILDETALIGIKHYNLYHFFHQSKKSIYTQENINYLINKDIYTDKKNNNTENSDKLLINDVASLSSSVASSVSRNNLLLYNKGNKRISNGEDITKNFKTSKFILFIIILLFLITLIIEYILLKLYSSNIEKEVSFYLGLSKYYLIYSRFFCSIISLSCVGIYSNDTNCKNAINEFSKYQMQNMNISQYDESTDLDIENMAKLISILFVNFQELLFNQEKIMSFLLEGTKENITNNLVEINKDIYYQMFEGYLTHYKINTNLDENDNLILTLKKENITFNDAILLITSRSAILSKNISDLENPIYILDKLEGNDIFKNIYINEKLYGYQEHFYLLILDHNEFIHYLNETISKVEKIVFDRMNLYQSYTKTVLIINAVFYLIIFFILFCYISIYLIIVFQILRNIYLFLNEKLGKVPIKELMMKKIENLKLILSFYEKDINITINDLNTLYHNYKDNYNIKIKEETKVLNKENKNNKNEKKKETNLFKLFTFKYFRIFFTYSTKKYIYIYSILFLIIIIIVLFIIYIIIYILFVKRENNAMNWISLSKGLSGSTNLLITNFLLMIYTNQTLSEISYQLPSNDFNLYLYTNLEDLYKAGGYLDNIKDLFLNTDEMIKYNCDEFYLNLNYPFFNLLLSKYKSNNDTTRFYFTLAFFCRISNIMEFNNYKTIYMQLFNPVENIMINFESGNYSYIVHYIEMNNIAGFEIYFFINYVYLLDLLNTNIQNALNVIIQEIKNKIDIFGIIFLISFFYLIFNVYFSFIRNIDNDCQNFIQMKKIFKVCNINE